MMSTSTRITVDQFDDMIAHGRFNRDCRDRLELIYGEIRPMSPIGPPHESLVDRLTEWSFRSLPAGAVWVRVQNSIGIPILDSAPEPDLVWVRRKDYWNYRPLAEDVLLVIEVADTSLAYDQGVKAGLYASAGIKEYWVANVPARSIEVRRDPEGSSYRSLEILRSGQEARPLAFPEVALTVSQLFSN
jgi:Uma2 family endonuclease